MEFRQYYATDASGVRAPGASVAVYTLDAVLVPLFDENGASILNPFTAGNSGLYGFAAANGDYDLLVGENPAQRIYLVDPDDLATEIAASGAAAVAAGTAAGQAAGEQSGTEAAAEATAAISEAQAETNAALQAVQASQGAIRVAVASAQDDASNALSTASIAEANLLAEVADRESGDATNAAAIVDLTTTVDGYAKADPAEIREAREPTQPTDMIAAKPTRRGGKRAHPRRRYQRDGGRRAGRLSRHQRHQSRGEGVRDRLSS